jgi:hypothetical protein
MDLLTGRRPAWLARPRGDRASMGVREGSPIVRRSDGRLRRAPPDGKLAATTLVSRVQTYLHAQRSREGEDLRARMSQ